jgi:hypothetical protein
MRPAEAIAGRKALKTDAQPVSKVKSWAATGSQAMASLLNKHRLRTGRRGQGHQHTSRLLGMALVEGHHELKDQRPR